MTTIVKVQIRHRVRFAPNNNPSFPTNPQFVNARLVRDIEEIPQGVKYLIFDDVVEVTFRLPEGREEVQIGEGVNEDLFHVTWDKAVASKWSADKTWAGGPLAVHPSLQGKVWVFPSSYRQVEEQRII